MMKGSQVKVTTKRLVVKRGSNGPLAQKEWLWVIR